MPPSVSSAFRTVLAALALAVGPALAQEQLYRLPGATATVDGDAVTVRYQGEEHVYVVGLGWLSGGPFAAPVIAGNDVLVDAGTLEALGVTTPRVTAVRASGDAEVRSWKEINKRSLVKSVHFLKISHHGSITGMPPEDVLGELLKADGTRRYVALSAYPDLEKQARGEQEWTYPEVPRQEVLGKLKSRADLQQTIQVADGGYIEYAFAGGTSNVTIGTSG